jgi:hypothetical protein
LVVHKKLTVCGMHRSDNTHVIVNTQSGAQGNATVTPVFRNLHFSNIHGWAGRAGDMLCLPESPCKVSE